jgi:carboxylesterase
MLHGRKRTLREQKMLGEGDRELFVEGRPPCIVAFHGFGGTVAELRPLLEAVAREGYAVDGALLEGHGGRVEALQDVRFDGWVDAGRARLRAARDRYGRVVLLGFSLGSLVAMQLASEQPEGLCGLVVLGNALWLHPLVRLPLDLWHRTGQAIPDLYLVKPFSGDLVDPAGLGSLVTYDRHPLRAALEVHLAGRRVRDRVDRVVCPTLVLHGRRDRVCPWKNAVWLAEHVGARDVSVRIFEKSAHVLAWDGEREEVAQEVARFLKRLPQA